MAEGTASVFEGGLGDGDGVTIAVSELLTDVEPVGAVVALVSDIPTEDPDVGAVPAVVSKLGDGEGAVVGGEVSADPVVVGVFVG